MAIFYNEIFVTAENDVFMEYVQTIFVKINIIPPPHPFSPT